jgi:hypothetical protein
MRIGKKVKRKEWNQKRKKRKENKQKRQRAQKDEIQAGIFSPLLIYDAVIYSILLFAQRAAHPSDWQEKRIF